VGSVREDRAIFTGTKKKSRYKGGNLKLKKTRQKGMRRSVPKNAKDVLSWAKGEGHQGGAPKLFIHEHKLRKQSELSARGGQRYLKGLRARAHGGRRGG